MMNDYDRLTCQLTYIHDMYLFMNFCMNDICIAADVWTQVVALLISCHFNSRAIYYLGPVIVVGPSSWTGSY